MVFNSLQNLISFYNVWKIISDILLIILLSSCKRKRQIKNKTHDPLKVIKIYSPKFFLF